MGWHGREPFPDQHTLTRDDLIRLVVGMQWREMTFAVCLAADEGHVVDGGISDAARGAVTPLFGEKHPPACDIVDEWLGVRK